VAEPGVAGAEAEDVAQLVLGDREEAVSPAVSPAVVVPKNQFVDPVSKAIEPPQGPKLLGVAARAPAFPRDATVSSQA
jgi:hypothetical protein